MTADLRTLNRRLTETFQRMRVITDKPVLSDADKVALVKVRTHSERMYRLWVNHVRRYEKRRGLPLTGRERSRFYCTNGIKHQPTKQAQTEARLALMQQLLAELKAND